MVRCQDCVCVLRREVVLDSLWTHWLWSARLLCPCDFPGKNTGVGFHFLFPGILLIQGLNPHLLLWQANSLPLRHLGSPRYQVYHLPLVMYSINICLFICTSIYTHTHTCVYMKSLKWLSSVCVCACMHTHFCLVTQSCLTLCDLLDYSPPGSVSWNFSGKKTGLGCHFLLLWICVYIYVCVAE